MAQFVVKRELQTQYLTEFHAVYAGCEKVASFSTNPKSAPFTHKCVPIKHIPALQKFVNENLAGKTPLMPLEIYDIFYTRNNG